MDTIPRLGDSDNTLLRKILQIWSAAPTPEPPGDDYYEAAPLANANEGSFSPGPTIMIWSTVIIGEGGTADSLEIYQSSCFGAYNLKLALYDVGGNRLAVVTTSSPGVLANDSYIVGVISAPVSAGTHYIAAIDDTGNPIWAADNGTVTLIHDASIGLVAYAAGPPATLPSPTTFDGQFVMRVHVTH